MARLALIVVPGLPHHVRQRGNRCEAIFFMEGDHEIYKDLLDRHNRLSTLLQSEPFQLRQLLSLGSTICVPMRPGITMGKHC